MEFLSYITNFLHYALSFVVILSIVVFIHEWGHFIVARIFGVKVEEFSIGFGKEIYGWNDKKGTRWKICMLPLGGFVKMYGDADESSTADNDKLKEMNEEDKKHSLHFKPLWQKALIVFAGPAINFILAFVLYSAIFTFNGKTEIEFSTQVGSVIEGGVADGLGIEVGDKIVSIGGEKVQYFSEIAQRTMLGASVETEISFERDGEVISKSFVPQTEYLKDASGEFVQVRLGIGSTAGDIVKNVSTDLSFTEALEEGASQVYDQSANMLHGVGQIITGERSVKEMGGPVKIAEYSGQFTENITKGLSCYFTGAESIKDFKEGSTCSDVLVSGLLNALLFTAMISTMLGLVNLFPIPMLDGGHLTFYAIEAIAQRPLGEKYQEWAFRAGFVFLIGLMLYVTYNDVISFVQRYILS